MWCGTEELFLYNTILTSFIKNMEDIPGKKEDGISRQLPGGVIG
jgi:hypothetical protein